MLNKEVHKLLSRQLKKVDKNLLSHPNFQQFLEQVNSAYKQFDNEVLRSGNVLEISHKELSELNQKLTHERDFIKSRLRNLVNNIGGVIFETDAEGNFTFLNNAWEVYSGYTIEECIGKNYKDFLIRTHIEQSNININNLFSRNKKQIKFIFQHQNRDRLMWFELRSKALVDDKNEVIGFIGTITNVTNLKETQIELQKANKSKDEFLSTMSHEIRTPLNAVTGLTNILLMEKYLPGQLEHLKALKYSGEHLLGLINDLLDFNKIKSGKLKLIEKDFNLSYLLENLKAHFYLRAEKRGVVFNVVTVNDIPKNIIGDRLKLTQIIKNLLSNSLKFTEKGSIVLGVKNLGLERNKVNLEFTVTDTGIGISKDKQALIFESFMQANSDTVVKYGGTGLGLAISKKLLELQNSDLFVESEEGKGSKFTFKIAYKVSDRLSSFERDMIKMQPNYKPLDINVLVAEDNKMNILIIKKFLVKWKVNFIIAENGEEVIKHLKSSDFSFDLILMDLQMPILDGYKTTRIIRNMEDTETSSVPIIALTAFAQTDIKEKTKRYGMDGFMSKPFNPEKLYKTLKAYSKENLSQNTG